MLTYFDNFTILNYQIDDDFSSLLAQYVLYIHCLVFVLVTKVLAATLCVF